MPADLPLACSLTSGEMTARLDEIGAVGAVALLDVRMGDGQAVLRFAPGDQTYARLAAVVTAEAQCCAFLEMQLREEPEALTLTIAAPAGAEPILQDLIAAFSGRRAV